MIDYGEANEIQEVRTIDVSALSQRAQRRLLQYVDQEGEAAMKEMVRIQRTVIVGNRAIAAQVSVSQC